MPTALVIDDEPFVRAVACRFLHRLGFATIELGDGSEAVSWFEGATVLPTLVLLDVNMPGLDGVSTLAALREAGVDTPALLSTGGNPCSLLAFDELSRDECVRFLQKPFRIAVLRERLDALGVRFAA